MSINIALQGSSICAIQSWEERTLDAWRVRCRTVMVWSWAVTSLRFFGRLFCFHDQTVSSLLLLIGPDILFLNPWLSPWCLLDLLVLTVGTVGSGRLSGFDVKEAGHPNYLHRLEFLRSGETRIESSVRTGGVVICMVLRLSKKKKESI